MVDILVCECQECTHWEIVRDHSGRVHLICKSCGRTDEVKIMMDTEQPAKWIPKEKE